MCFQVSALRSQVSALSISQDTGGFLHVLIAPATEVADDDLIRRHLTGALHGISDAVRGLERGHDAFDRAKRLGTRRSASAVGRVAEVDAALLLVIGVLGADSRVVEASGDRVREVDLAVRVLEDPSLRALQHAQLAPFEIEPHDARA